MDESTVACRLPSSWPAAPKHILPTRRELGTCVARQQLGCLRLNLPEGQNPALRPAVLGGGVSSYGGRADSHSPRAFLPTHASFADKPGNAADMLCGDHQPTRVTFSLFFRNYQYSQFSSSGPAGWPSPLHPPSTGYSKCFGAVQPRWHALGRPAVSGRLRHSPVR